MICPNCLEPYEFVEFDVDPDTLEHRGVFCCECFERLLFPESLTREMLSDDDLVEQLRISRLFQLRMSLNEFKKHESHALDSPTELKNMHLQRYIEHLSDPTLRQFK